MIKRKAGLIFIFCITIVALLFGIYILTDDDNNEEDVKNEMEQKEPEYTLDVVSKVFYGTISNTYVCSGIVNSVEENYVDIIESYFENTDKVELKVSIGDTVNANDEIFTVNGKVTKAQADGLISDIYMNGNRITIDIINYEKMYIDVPLDYEIYEDIQYDSVIKVDNDGELLKGQLLNKGYRLEGDCVNAKVGFDGYILPGKQVEVQIETGVTAEMLFVPSEMVYDVNGVAFCYVVGEDGQIEERQIETGKEYISVEDGHKFSYTEIVSGVWEGEKIATLAY